VPINNCEPIYIKVFWDKNVVWKLRRNILENLSVIIFQVKDKMLQQQAHSINRFHKKLHLLDN
jgi:hypothetical protein